MNARQRRSARRAGKVRISARCRHRWIDTGWQKPMSPPLLILRCERCGVEGWRQEGQSRVDVKGVRYEEGAR